MDRKEIVNRHYRLPKILIHSVKMLSLLSTRITVGVLEYFFYRPIKFKVPEREKIFIMKSEKSHIQVDEIESKIQIYRLRNTGKKILFVHGWNGRAGQFHRIAEECHEAGFDITAFDLPGHGQSTRKSTALPEIVSAIHGLHEEFGKFDFVVGHSIGAIAVVNLPRFDMDFDRLVTISLPANDVRSLFSEFVGMFRLPKKKYTDLLIKGASEKFNAHPNSFDPGFVCSDIACETLVIHCKDDKDANFNESVIFHESLGTSRLHLTAGLGHNRILRDAGVSALISEFFKN